MIEALQAWIRVWGIPGIFVFVALENVGIPWPTALAFIVALDLIRQGALTFPAAVLLITAAHVFGSCLGYILGRKGDNFIVRRLRGSDALVRARNWLHRWYEHHGSVTVFVARLVGYVRPWASIVAGMAEVPGPAFVAWTAAGSVVYAIVALKVTGVGFWAWDAFPGWHTEILIGIAIVFWGIAIYLIVRGIRSRGDNGDGANAS